MKRVFLDYASITPLDKRVEAEMKEVQKTAWANPSSLHSEGESAKKILEEARNKIARLLHCRAAEIIFTSGGTESLNLAILGVIKKCQEDAHLGTPHIIVSSIEHPAVLEPIKNLLKEGRVEVSFISPNEAGIISPESIKRELKENTVLVAIQHANNEIGVIQPISKISKIIKNFRDELRSKNYELRKGKSEMHNSGLMIHNSPLLLVDASQSFLYENVSLERLQADLLVLDGIKIYGPRGAGVLVVRHGVEISPVTFGGGQESGLRSGTENVPAAAGLAKALEIGVEMREKESIRLSNLRDYAFTLLRNSFPNCSVNGSVENRLPNNINVCLPGTDSEFLVIKLDTLGLAVSAASACHTLSLENSSYVINALGNNCGSSSLRFTLGRATRKSDLDSLVSALKKIIK